MYIGEIGDFDFLVGHWKVANRRLRERHVGCTAWDEFPGEHIGLTLHGGAISTDEFRFPTEGFSGCTFRTLEREQRRWAIYWVNSADGLLQPPVFGGFDGARGEFGGEDMDGTRPVLVRFIWRRDRHAPRWEQAFSTDGGDSWETNWTMDFSRASG